MWTTKCEFTDPKTRQTLLDCCEADEERGQLLFKNLAKPPMFTTLRCNTLRDSPTRLLQTVKEYLVKKGYSLTAYLHPVVNDVIIIDNSGPHHTQQVPKEVIVDVHCAMALLRGADIFIQGVLASSTDVNEDDKVSVFCDVTGVCLKGAKPPFNFPKIYLGNGTALFSRHKLFTAEKDCRRRGVAVAMIEPLFVCPSLNEFLPELVFAQNLPSTLCVHVLDPQPHDVVLDMCTAPGGKLTHIGALMNNEGTLVALDKAKNKLVTVKENLRRWGVDIAQVYCFDASKAVEDNAELPQLNKGPPYPPHSFDKILLDAPCSALGQRPSLCNKMSHTELSSYPKLQRKLLTAATQLLRPGGTLVYSTCTFTAAENENQVSWLLQEVPQMSLVQQTPFIADEIQQTKNSLSAEQMNKLQRFHPGYLSTSPSKLNCNTDTIGFFIAKFTKV